MDREPSPNDRKLSDQLIIGIGKAVVNLYKGMQWLGLVPPDKIKSVYVKADNIILKPKEPAALNLRPTQNDRYDLFELYKDFTIEDMFTLSSEGADYSSVKLSRRDRGELYLLKEFEDFDCNDIKDAIESKGMFKGLFTEE